MRIEGHLYTYDHRGGCDDCGSPLKAVFYYTGYRTDQNVYNKQSALTGTQTTTVITNYADVRRLSACYCPECKKKKEDARWAARSKPDPLNALSHKKKSQRQGIIMLLLAVGLPVAFGFGAAAANRAGNNNTFSFFMLLTIGTALFGIRLFFGGIDKLRFHSLDADIAEIKERAACYPSAETEIIGVMRRREANPRVTYFSEAEYQKLQKKR